MSSRVEPCHTERLYRPLHSYLLLFLQTTFLSSAHSQRQLQSRMLPTNLTTFLVDSHRNLRRPSNLPSHCNIRPRDNNTVSTLSATPCGLTCTNSLFLFQGNLHRSSTLIRMSMDSADIVSVFPSAPFMALSTPSDGSGAHTTHDNRWFYTCCACRAAYGYQAKPTHCYFCDHPICSSCTQN